MKDVIPCKICGGNAESERHEFSDCYACDTCGSVQIDGKWFLGGPDPNDLSAVFAKEGKEGQR